MTVVHYRNPRKSKRTICGHDCTISGRTYSHITSRLDKVSCKACINAIANNKSIRKKIEERFNQDYFTKCKI